MRLLVTQDEAGGTAYLTNETCASRYGIPVLEITAADVDGDFGPADLIGDLDPPETLCRAADVVVGWASQPDRTDEEREAARRYLRQWPEGPQVD